MKIIQSFWSGKNKSIQNKYGWFDYQYHWLSWMLSCHQLRKFYDQVELYTDAFGYEILIEKLKLPYTKVHVVLDELNELPDELWAMAKIKVYSLQNEPFLHVDGDIFIFEAFPQELMRADLIAQNQETTTNYYRDKWSKIFPHLTYLPKEMKEFHKQKSNVSYNMGIFGGSDIDVIKEYSKKAAQFVFDNINKIDDFKKIGFNVFFEQVFLGQYAISKNKQMNLLLSAIYEDGGYNNFADFEKTPYKKKFLHLLGVFKEKEIVCKKMENYCLFYYPSFFKTMREMFPNKYFFLVEHDLTQKDNEDFINWYEENIFIETPNDNKRLLARNLYTQRQLELYDNFENEKEDYYIALLLEISFEEQEDNYILFREDFGENIFLKELDTIDEILLVELSKGMCIKRELFEKFINYLKKSPLDNDLNSLRSIFSERLKDYLTNKIAVVISVKREEIIEL